MCKQAYKFRLYPTRKQEQLLTWTLDRARELYNAALQERKDAYRIAGKSINYYDQANQLPEIKEVREEYQDIHSQVLQDVLRRVDKAMKAFFRRVKAGEKPGYPRFQGRNRYDSFCYPQGGYSLTADNRVYLSKIGSIKVKLYRKIQGTIKTTTIKREGDAWYIVFSCEAEPLPKLPSINEAIGIDLGLTHFATLSTGDTIDNPRHFRRAEKKLAKAQQKLARKKKGSNRRQKAVKQVGKLHRKVRRQRQDFLHKQSRQLVNTYEMLVFEDIKPAHLSRRPKPKQDEDGTYLPNGASAKGGLNKSINDAGWSQFIAMCEYKAESAGISMVRVDPRYTSQICSGCGTVKKKDLSERWHSCECGTELDRDHNAALNILALGRRAQQTRC